MPSVCLYFQVHQPYRLRKLFYLDSNPEWDYFDEDLNRRITEEAAERGYLPANRLMLALIKRFRGKFKISYSISGTALEQLCRYAPAVLESFRTLASTGCVEFLGETYYHSFASVFDEAEFVEQVEHHRRVMRETFGITPTVFRNTDLLYSDRIGLVVERLGFKGILVQAVDYVLGWRSPNYLYGAEGAGVGLLVRNAQLSDDVAVRFSNREWVEFPLSADKYASWISNIDGSGDIVNIFLGYDAFGERHSAESGIFEFMEHFPAALLKRKQWSFCTPSEALARYDRVGRLSYPLLTSWTDLGCDTGAWLGSGLQGLALAELYRISSLVRGAGNARLLDVWRKLQSSDHFHYMHTAWYGAPQSQISPFANPHDGYIYYMNTLRDFTGSVRQTTGAGKEFVTYPEALRVKAVANS